MKNIIYIFLIILGCNGVITDSTDEYQSNIALRDDLTESEFKEAIIGHWKNQFEISGKQNVETLDISSKGTARVVIIKNNIQNRYSGKYTVNFLRSCEENTVTLAEIVISIHDENLVLSRVNFGSHNALGSGDEYFLRIDNEPFGVMKKIN